MDLLGASEARRGRLAASGERMRVHLFGLSSVLPGVVPEDFRRTYHIASGRLHAWSFTLACLVFLLSPLRVAAQSASANARQGPLSIPRSEAVRCLREPFDSTASRGSKTYRFEIGEDLSDSRTLLVEFDSVGKPISLQELDAEVTPAGATTDIILAVFRDGRVVGGFHSHLDARLLAKARADTLSDPRAPLTQVQKKLAADLAEWLWKRRCASR
jgi:hypothetical protein